MNHTKLPTQGRSTSPLKARRLPLCMAITAAMALGFAAPASATTYTWDGGAGAGLEKWSQKKSAGSGQYKSNWTGSNTSSAQPSFAAGSSLVFAGTTGLSNSNDFTGLSLNGISFAAGAGKFIVNGNAITSTGNISNNSSNLQNLGLNVTVGANQTWDGGSQGMSFNGLVDIAGGLLTLANRVAIGSAARDFHVAQTGSKGLTIASGSSLMSYAGSVGVNSSSSGTVLVTGASSLWKNSDDLNLGNDGKGELSIENGGVVSNKYGVVGRNAASAGSTVKVNGVGSQWNSSADLYIGNAGQGTLNIEAGGVVNNTSAYIGKNAGSRGGVSVTGLGSTWDSTQSMYVGNDGSGTLSIQAGGSVRNTNGNIGFTSGSSGVVTVTGAGSSWVNALQLAVGNGGTGELWVLGGGQVGSAGSFIGKLAGASGAVTVSAVGSQWLDSVDITIGNLGQGSLTVEQGGSVVASRDLIMARPGQGTLTIQSGGSVSNGKAYVGKDSGGVATVTVTGAGSRWTSSDYFFMGYDGSGTLNIESGGAVESKAYGFIGYNAGGKGAVVVRNAGSSWTNNKAYLSLGDAGEGSLQILDGGLVSSSTAYLGKRATGKGEATVDGKGSKWSLDTKNIYVGSLGQGTLLVQNGGVVSNASAYVGSELGSVGSVTVDGAGSQWNNTGDLYVGDLGKGVLLVQNGAVVGNAGGFVGNKRGSVGSVTVSGAGSQWTNTEGVAVGYLGSGTLSIEGGGVVNSAISSFIGQAKGSSGSVTVDGAGSQWLLGSKALNVGNLGTGALLIQNGGVVSDQLGYVGKAAGGVGTATVTGKGSLWSHADGLYIGSAGSGVLSILNAAKVAVAASLTLGAQGVINLDGGSLELASVQRTAGGVFNWISGSLNILGGAGASLGSGLLDSALTLVSGQILNVSNQLFVSGNSSLALSGGKALVGSLGQQGELSVGNSSSLVVGDGGMNSTGTLQLAGGTLNGSGALVNNGEMAGYGTIAGSGGFSNRLALLQTGGNLTLSNTGANSNIGNWDLALGKQLKLVGATLSNQGALNLNGGIVTGTGTGSLINGVDGTIEGRGVIASLFQNDGRIVLNAGNLRIDRTFVSSGQINLTSTAAALTGGSIYNSGRIQGAGQISNAIDNSGRVAAQGTGLTLTLNGDVGNNNYGGSLIGVLAAEKDATLLINKGLASNLGQIQLAGGTLDNNGKAMVNQAGASINGFGTLRSGTLTNKGQIFLSGGTSALRADIVAGAGSQIILSGLSNNTFYGKLEVQKDAELRVTEGSVATFAAEVKQRGGADINGDGKMFFEGGLSIGNSPGYGYIQGSVTFTSSNSYAAEIGGVNACTTLSCADGAPLLNSNFDKLVVGGNLKLGGKLVLASWNGFVAQVGQSFDLLDWGTINGTSSGVFKSIDASGFMLAAGTQLDFSQLYSSGTISVTAVPEPGSWALMLAGLLGLGAIAKRRRALPAAA